MGSEEPCKEEKWEYKENLSGVVRINLESVVAWEKNAIKIGGFFIKLRANGRGGKFLYIGRERRFLGDTAARTPLERETFFFGAHSEGELGIPWEKELWKTPGSLYPYHFLLLC